MKHRMVRLVSLEEDEEQEARIRAIEKMNMNLMKELHRVQWDNYHLMNVMNNGILCILILLIIQMKRFS